MIELHVVGLVEGLPPDVAKEPWVQILDAVFRERRKKELEAAGLRVEVDSRAEKVGWKIRQATMEKVPYMLTVGDKECEEKTVAVRKRNGEDLGSMTVAELTAKLVEEVRTKQK